MAEREGTLHGGVREYTMERLSQGGEDGNPPLRGEGREERGASMEG